MGTLWHTTGDIKATWPRLIEIITNKKLIALDQDPLGKTFAQRRHRYTDSQPQRQTRRLRVQLRRRKTCGIPMSCFNFMFEIIRHDLARSLKRPPL